MHAHVRTQGWWGAQCTCLSGQQVDSHFTPQHPYLCHQETDKQVSVCFHPLAAHLANALGKRNPDIWSPKCPQQSLPLKAKAGAWQAGRRGAPPNCQDPRVPTCRAEAKGDSTLEAGAQWSLGPLDKTCHFTASFLKKYSLDPVFKKREHVVSSFFFLASSEPGILRVIFNLFVSQDNCLNFLNPKCPQQ